MFPLQLTWKCGPDMPFAMTGYVQAVVVGNVVFVGGGSADKKTDDYVLMAYDLLSSEWRRLPPYNAKYFALVSSKDKLILVGGQNPSSSNVSFLGMWEVRTEQWMFPYPPMPTARSYVSAIQYKNWLVVAGGWGDSGTTLSTVEILDTETKQWYAVQQSPISWDSMKSVVVGDTWFLLGGSYGLTWTGEVYTASLGSLISYTQPLRDRAMSQSIWQKISNLQHNSSTPLSIENYLVALGGRSDRNV